MLATYRAITGQDPDEFDSARDDDGHGTHTASTAAGNQDVMAEALGIDRGTVSGIAPRARVIAYKGLGNLGGYGSDLAAAIDQAVADGVDVINYSVGGGPSLTGDDDIAYLFAADAGVFVATSASNNGPGPDTIGGPASVPWLISVGASTQPRSFDGTVTLGNGASLHRHLLHRRRRLRAAGRRCRCRRRPLRRSAPSMKRWSMARSSSAAAARSLASKRASPSTKPAASA